MTYRVRIAPRAADQIREAASWWLEHRPAPPDVLVHELDRAIDLIATWPDGGQPAPDPHHMSVRRVLLRRVRYHLYYVPSHDERVVIVLALWHSSRGTEPEL